MSAAFELAASLAGTPEGGVLAALILAPVTVAGLVGRAERKRNR